MSEEVRICIFAGHTGGHLFPALAFAQRLKKRFPQSRITLMTSPKAKPLIEPLAAQALDSIEYLNEFPLFSGISLRAFRFLLEFCRAFILSAQKLSRLRPQLCVGFGSYVSYPGMKIACWMGIPTLIHEQNKIAGKATKHLTSHVDLTAVSFPETVTSSKPRMLQVVGLPVREGMYKDSRDFERIFSEINEQNPLRLFITGGSQGAHKLNKVILQSFSCLFPEETKKIAVTHITGTQDFEWVKGEYKKMKINAAVFSFYGNMQELYRQSDFAVTRAGANTLFELALFGVPAMSVPFPFAAENHQEVNARYFESQHALRVENEMTLTPEKLAHTFREMMNPAIRRELSENILKMAPEDAAQRLADLASKLLLKEPLCK